MKSMSDKSLGWSKGSPKSDGFFPSEPQNKVMGLPGSIPKGMYPDNQEDILRDQNQAVKSCKAGKAKEGYRH